MEMEADPPAAAPAGAHDGAGAPPAEDRRQPRRPQGGGGGPQDHLLVLVHGILASSADFAFMQRKLARHLGPRFLLHGKHPPPPAATLGIPRARRIRTSARCAALTLQGLALRMRSACIPPDGLLAAKSVQVAGIVKRNPHLERISFVAHSLGGLFARYAIAKLYQPSDPAQAPAPQGAAASHLDGAATLCGLLPVSFVTLATPHLGVSGHKQLPFLLGLSFLERVAMPIAPFVAGQTGRQLFLSDKHTSGQPLLLDMTSDCEEGPFISALGLFQLRAAYANVGYDHLVGWRTSSIRRESELPKVVRSKAELKYKHILAVHKSLPLPSCNESERKQGLEQREMAEDCMVSNLQQVSWLRVDVSFHSAVWPFFAHNNVHVKQPWFHFEGAEVIRHLIDLLVQQEQNVPLLQASL
eukprot:SM000213S06819  [mRNA]  locus=s213:141011:144121:+ [translate_table: standard]